MYNGAHLREASRAYQPERRGISDVDFLIVLAVMLILLALGMAINNNARRNRVLPLTNVTCRDVDSGSIPAESVRMAGRRNEPWPANDGVICDGKPAALFGGAR